METKFKETEIGQIPQEWEIARLGKYCRVQGGFAFRSSDYIEEGVPLVRISNIKDEFVDCSNSPYLPVDYVEQYPEFIVTKGDILIAMSGATTGKVGIYNNIEPVLLNQRVGRYIVIDENKILQKFLRFLVDLPSYRNKALVDANGAAQPNVAPARLEHVIIAIPSLPEQRKIAEILSTVDQTIEKTDAIIQETQQLKKGLMQKLFTEGIGHTQFKETEIGRLPEEWEVATFGKVIKSFHSGVSRNLSSEDIGVPVIRSTNIQDNMLTLDDLRYWYWDDPQGTNLKNYILDDGDVLINFINSVAQIGKCCIFTKQERDYIFTTNIFRVKVNDSLISNSYLYFFSQTLSYRLHISSITKPAVNQASFTKGDFLKMKLPLSSRHEQDKIVAVLSEVDAKIKKEQAFKSELERLKKGLMQVLLTGKVRVKV